MKTILSFLLFVLAINALAQPPQQADFLAFQKSFRKVSDVFARQQDKLKAEFEAKGLVWPARYVYIRSFKWDAQLEVWVKNTRQEKYRLFKTYKVCAMAGSLGPKRFEGDYQVPEGFYYLNQFRPNSQYHLALGINYPNPSDRVLSDPQRPGAEIYIHGSCVTVGCIPLTDPIIEEVYTLTAFARQNGQDFMPIHVFPVRFRNPKSADALKKYLEKRPDYKPMVDVMTKVYYYFNENKNLPTILISEKGEYRMLQEYTMKPEAAKYVPNTEPRREPSKVANLTDKDFFSSVYKQAVFPGGLPAFQKYLDKLQEDLVGFKPEGSSRTYVQVDFVIDREGNVVNVQVAANANNEMANLILDRFEGMPRWTPAERDDRAVPIRYQQTLVVEGRNKAPKHEDDDL
jgi:murein L,D-transpeptidase YafK